MTDLTNLENEYCLFCTSLNMSVDIASAGVDIVSDVLSYIALDPTGAIFSHYENKTDPGFIAATNEQPDYVDAGRRVWKMRTRARASLADI